MLSQEVARLYLSGLSTREVATALGIGKTQVGNIILQLGISRARRIRESVLLSKVAKCKPFDGSFIAYLDGLLISDGCLYSTSKIVKTAFYSQTSVRRKWLLDIKRRFKQQGIKSTLRKDTRQQYKRGFAWTLVSGYYHELYDQHQRWYRTDKIVPTDLLIDEAMVKNWIYGDGTLCGSTLRLCTDSFTLEEVHYLMRRLSARFNVSLNTVFMGISKEGHPKYRISLCQAGGLTRLLAQIGKPISCFQYKWFQERG